MFDGFVRFNSITLEKIGDLYRCACCCSVLPWDEDILMEETCCNGVNSSQKPIVLCWQAVDPWCECFWQNNAISAHSVKGVVDGCGAVIDDRWYNVGDFVHGYLLKSASGDAIVLRKYHHDLCCTGVFEL